MPFLRRLNDRNQVTIPPSLLREVGVQEGGFVAIETEKGRIIIEPRDVGGKGLDKGDWRALDALVKRQVKARQFSEYPHPKAARTHFRRLNG